MNIKWHLFNGIAGLFITAAMITAIVDGSSVLPYVFIVLFLGAYWLQKIDYKGFTRTLGLIMNIFLFIFSVPLLMDFIIPLAP
ncbi:hypothetical protein [Mesobacillus foraminis]|uniref:hypothetical protein n=1 Tax=Mesobacillus foraminis TaxID=279826 RepID=UPI000EF49E48|nr:hypothetical protein [Mesobacillus foraminis]